MRKNIFISGMHSGQNPCSGVGIARAIRKAFPEIQLIGVDHWQGSSGLHHDVVDDVLILPQWKQMDRDKHILFLKSLLDEGHLWISALDVEVYWLAQNFGCHSNLLAPSGTALELTAKPYVQAFSELGFAVPESISAFQSDAEVHTFLRQHSWQCWLKGPYHEAKRISSWESFERNRDGMQKDWKTSRLFLQRHIAGHEESICFAAHQGKLLSCIHMQKRLITAEGKTWAGKVTPIEGPFLEKFRKVIQGLEWSGGGEIEFTRDQDGKKWIIECNPRFPAWIFGAALAGHNLPGQLISSALQIPFQEESSAYPCFTRVVHEIAAKENIGLPYPPDPALTVWSADGQKGKGGPSSASMMPRLRDTMIPPLEAMEDDDTEDESTRIIPEQSVPEAYFHEIARKAQSFQGETPSRQILEEWTFSRFQSLVQSIKQSHPHPQIRIGYSVKTSATDEHLSFSKKLGFLTECISQLEIERALQSGVSAGEIILNGPGKFWPLTKEPMTGLHMLFSDSVEEFDRVLEIWGIAKVLGFRIQLPNLPSRFGVAVDKLEAFQQVLDRVRRLKNKAQLGFHFHMPSWAIGVQRWRSSFQSLLTWCQAVEQLTGVCVRHLDLGGGFFPSDLERMNLRWIQEAVREALPKVEAIYFEPGRSLTQEGEALFSRVLDVRRSPDQKVSEIIVDACIAELPLIQMYSHRVFYQGQCTEGPSHFLHLKKGETKVLGRICMENDILSKGLEVPEAVKIGDLIIFGDAGAYERSMSYDFGRG